MATALLGLGAAAAVSHYALQKAKKNLAHVLAESMSEYLEVDPAQIESKLVSPSSQLVLNNIRLKPIQLTSTVRQVGVVDRINFTWKWGGSKDGSTAFVRDAQLVVTGARIRLLVSTCRNGGGYDQKTSSSSSNEERKGEKTTDKKKDADDATTSGYLQQILDSLTLQIMDLQVLVEVQPDGDASIQDEASTGCAGSSGAGVMLEAHAIKLVSLGRDSSHHGPTVRSDTGEEYEEIDWSDVGRRSPLLQTVSIEQVCAYLVPTGTATASPKKTNNDRVYVVEPFGYTADVKRVSGERFSGLDFGLDIVGSMIPVPGREQSDPVVTVHAGTKQLQTLLQIFDIVSSSFSKDDDSEKNEAASSGTSYSTSFVLHLPSVILVLPNGSTIQTFFWCHRQRADGSVNNIQAKGAVTVNGTQSFVLLEDDSCFFADFITNQIFLQASKEQGTESSSSSSHAQSPHLARATWQESHMKKVKEGVKQAALLVNFDYNDEKTNTRMADAPPQPPAPSKQPAWSFEAKDGTISLRMEGQEDGVSHWAEASLDSPAVILPDRPDELPKELSFLGATLGPTPFGDATLCMGSMHLKTDSFKKASVDDMQSFINRALGFSSF